MKNLALVLCLSLLPMAGMTACTQNGTTSSAVGVSQDTLNSAKKSLTVAHQAYNALGQALIVAANNGTLKGPDAANAKKFYDTAGDYLGVADKAADAANATDLNDAIKNAYSAISSAQALLVKG